MRSHTLAHAVLVQSGARLRHPVYNLCFVSLFCSPFVCPLGCRAAVFSGLRLETQCCACALPRCAALFARVLASPLLFLVAARCRVCCCLRDRCTRHHCDWRTVGGARKRQREEHESFTSGTNARGARREDNTTTGDTTGGQGRRRHRRRHGQSHSHDSAAAATVTADSHSR